MMYCCCSNTSCHSMSFVRCIENIFRMQRTLCSLFRPSLQLLSVSTSVDSGLGHLMKNTLTGKPALTGKSLESAGLLDTLNTTSATLAASHLKKLTSMCCILECYRPVWAWGNPPLSRHFPTPLSSMSISIFSFFSFSYSCFIYFLAFHHFPFYQNSPTSFPRPDVVGGD